MTDLADAPGGDQGALERLSGPDVARTGRGGEDEDAVETDTRSPLVVGLGLAALFHAAADFGVSARG